MTQYRLPNGELTKRRHAYVDAWRAQAQTVMRVFGWQLCSFDPGYTFIDKEQRIFEMTASRVRSMAEVLDLQEAEVKRAGELGEATLRLLHHFDLTPRPTAAYAQDAEHARVLLVRAEGGSVEAMIRKHGLRMPTTEERQERLDRETGLALDEESKGEEAGR